LRSQPLCLFLAIRTSAIANWRTSIVQFDRAAVTALNGYAQRSVIVDRLVWAISGDYMVEGAVMLALLWWAWFAARDTSTGLEQRRLIVSSLIGLYVTAIAMLAIRDALPLRPRPIVDPALALQVPSLPGGEIPSYFSRASSFPSGHAAVFFALTTGLWSISVPLGLLGAVHAIFIVCLPRMYLGIHYPSDLFAGAILAIATVSLTNCILRRRPFITRTVAWSQERPAMFYSLFFIASVEIATVFESVRRLLRLLALFGKLVQ
jgi:undecaprenyl-diphosphatase